MTKYDASSIDGLNYCFMKSAHLHKQIFLKERMMMSMAMTAMFVRQASSQVIKIEQSLTVKADLRPRWGDDVENANDGDGDGDGAMMVMMLMKIRGWWCSQWAMWGEESGRIGRVAAKYSRLFLVIVQLTKIPWREAPDSRYLTRKSKYTCVFRGNTVICHSYSKVTSYLNK